MARPTDRDRGSDEGESEDSIEVIAEQLCLNIDLDSEPDDDLREVEREVLTA